MTKSELQSAAINYTIDKCANNIRVAGIIGILDGLDMEIISIMISKIKNYNNMAIEELLNRYEYSGYQRVVFSTALERESDVAAMVVKHCYDNYRRTNK